MRIRCLIICKYIDDMSQSHSWTVSSRGTSKEHGLSNPFVPNIKFLQLSPKSRFYRSSNLHYQSGSWCQPLMRMWTSHWKQPLFHPLQDDVHTPSTVETSTWDPTAIPGTEWKAIRHYCTALRQTKRAADVPNDAACFDGPWGQLLVQFQVEVDRNP